MSTCTNEVGSVWYLDEKEGVEEGGRRRLRPVTNGKLDFKQLANLYMHRYRYGYGCV